MDLNRLRDFAAQHSFNLTAPLDHAQVTALANHWLPQMRFYHDERYHPIGLTERINMVDTQFQAMEAITQESFKVSQVVKDTAGFAVSEKFNPPILTVPDGVAPHRNNINQSVSTVKVLTETQANLVALADASVGSSARQTHGASEARSNRFFGGVETVLKSGVPAAGDPLLPRATIAGETDTDEENNSQITVTASYKNLLDTLEYNLMTQADSDYPEDVMRSGFDIVSDILPFTGNSAGTPQPTEAQRRALLLDLITAHKSGNPLPTILPGLRFDKFAWDTLTRYAFLEFCFYYAYNDFERYQTAIFDNEHEGDNEGCCLVFDRNAINLALSTGQLDTLLMVQPHSILTSVHEEYTSSDCAMIFPTGTGPVSSPAELREALSPTVWIAGGSHATYLTPGTHDLVDFGDYLGWVNENAPWLWIGAPAVLTIAVVLHILEHFIDTEDFTSDDGIKTGPDTDPVDKLRVVHRLQVTPMSEDTHVYQDQDLLTVAAFPGFWGDHDGAVDKSGPYTPKTGRYFRRLQRLLD